MNGRGLTAAVFLIGLVVFGSGYYSRMQRQAFEAHAIEVDGIVVALEESDREGEASRFDPVVKFGDFTGRRYLFRGSPPPDGKQYALGDRVMVWIDPRETDPSETAVLNKEKVPSHRSWLQMGLGFAAMLWAVGSRLFGCPKDR